MPTMILSCTASGAPVMEWPVFVVDDDDVPAFAAGIGVERDQVAVVGGEVAGVSPRAARPRLPGPQQLWTSVGKGRR